LSRLGPISVIVLSVNNQGFQFGLVGKSVRADTKDQQGDRDRGHSRLS